MRQSNRERLIAAKRIKQERVELDLNGLLRLLLGGELNPTQRDFIYSPERVTGYKGPAGCAKTSTLCAKTWSRALLHPGSRHLVSRYDYNDLMETTAQRMEEMLYRLPKGILLDRDKSPPMKWWINPATKGDPSVIIFMGLKDYPGGYDFNTAIIDEASECEEQAIQGINSRLRTPGGNYALSMAFNPPAKTHWLYTACTGRNAQEEFQREPWIMLFNPKPRENIANLPPDYYEELAKRLPSDMRQRLVDGEWGSTFEGEPVYRQFKFDLHCNRALDSGKTFSFNPHKPLVRAWDFGYNRPACLWMQVDWQGRLTVLREETGQFIEATQFAQRCKAITATEFAHAVNLIDYGDPAVTQHKDTGSTLAAFAREGIQMLFKHNDVMTGVDLARKMFETLIDGEPAIQIDLRRCPMLVDALKGGYRLDKKGEKPFKDGIYEHVADAFRYGVDNLFGSGSNRWETAVNVGSLEYKREADHY